jgi:ATP-dependent Lon protease
MTGEISLNGKVLQIGGLKEKIVAARREGVTTVVIPEANRHSWEELAETLKTDLTAVFVTEYPEVFQVAFPDLKT